MIQNRLILRQIVISLFVIGLSIGFGLQADSAHARVSLSQLQADIEALQAENDAQQADINDLKNRMDAVEQEASNNSDLLNAITGPDCPEGQAVVGVDMDGNILCEQFEQNVALAGTVRKVDGSILPVNYILCGTGDPGQCIAQTAKDSCADIGQRVVSHASNGTSEVASLGATNSCQFSVSYYTVNNNMPSDSCLVAVSNLEWSSCCGTNSWHGNTIFFGTPGNTFGYVWSSNSGYVPTYPNVYGKRWGCNNEVSASYSLSGCNEEYVACTP